MLRRDASPDEDALTFPSFLLHVGEGRLKDSFTSFIGPLVSVLVGSDVKQLIDFVLPDVKNKLRDENWFSERAVLIARNDTLEAVNIVVGDMILGLAKQYASTDNIDSPDEQKLRYLVELLSGMPGTASLPDHMIIGFL